MANKPRIHLVALLFFFVASLLLLRPLPSRFFDGLQGYGDIWMVTWNFWWAKKSLLSGLNPFHTDYLYYPNGVSMYFHAFSPFNAFLSVPLGLVMNPCAVNNFFFIASFVLAGYAGFLLTHHLTGNIPASLMAGYIYTFSPYHFSHRHQVEHFSIQWPAFLVLALLRFRDRPTPARAGVAGLLFLVTFYSNVYYGLYMAIFVVLFFSTAPSKRWWIFLGVAGIGLFPYLVKMFSVPSGFKSPFWIHVHQSQDLLAFFTPSSHNPIFASAVAPVYERFTSGEPIGYLGFSVIALALFGIEKKHRFLAGITLLFLVLSLGPFLHVGGRILPVPLPQMILQHLPVISAARVPGRYISVAMIGLSMLAGLGAAHLWRGGRKKLVGFLGIVLVVEYFNAPMLITDPPYPAYTRIIAADPDDCVIMDLPHPVSNDPAEWWRSSDPDTRGWYQTLHGKKSMTGPASHTALNRNHFLYLINTPALAPFTTDSDFPDRAIAKEEIKKLNLRYFILHRDDARDREYLHYLGAKCIHRDEYAELYRFETSP